MNITPKKPHWKFIFYTGSEHPEWDESFDTFDAVLREMKQRIDFLPERLEHLPMAEELWRSGPPREVIERLLVERVSHGVIRDVLRHKFNIDVTESVIETYNVYFFDNKTFNNVELYEMLGSRMPQAPPVPGAMRSSYAAFKAGGAPDLNIDDAMQHMFARTFFRSQELSEMGWHGDDKALKFMKEAVSMYKTLKENNTVSDMPEEFDIVIEYPDDAPVAVSLEDLDGDYDGE